MKVNFGYVLGGALALGVWANAQSQGFDLKNLSVPRHEVGSGGVPRDGIPAIDDPKFWSVEEAEGFLFNNDVLMSFGGGAAATGYPLRILAWHEIVNDEVDGKPIAVTYCPLCGTGMVFSRKVEGQTGKVLSFGVSGLLFRSDVLMYDRQTESLWSQLESEAVAGPMVGAQLDWLPSEQLTWKAWKTKYPDGRILSRETGYDRPYNKIPYEGYVKSPYPIFKVPTTRNELPMKAWVIGVKLGDETKAYRVAGLKTGEFIDELGGRPIRITYDRGSRHFQAWDDEGGRIPAVWCYWFAWQAFNPETVLVNKLR